MEHDSPDLSEPQRVSLKKVLFRVCADIPKTDLLTELWSWDFLESEEKDEWKKRIEDQYSALRSSVK